MKKRKKKRAQTKRGAPRSIESRPPGEIYRRRAFTRVTMRFATPELARDKARQHRVTNRLSEAYRIDISAGQWKVWWDGTSRPWPRTIAQFKRHKDLAGLTTWLEQSVKGVPLQRHLCAFDAVIDARSHDETRRDAALTLAREVTRQIELIWAPHPMIGRYSYMMSVPRLPYLYGGDGLYPDVTVEPTLGIALSQRMPKDWIWNDGIYDPFNPNSIATYLLAQGLNGFPMEKVYRHWVVDFASLLLCLNVIWTIHYVTAPLSEPTDLGKISELIELFLAQGPGLSTLKHNLKRWPFTFPVDPDKLERVMLRARADYKAQLAEIGVDVHEFWEKWSDSIFTGYRQPPGELQLMRSLLGIAEEDDVQEGAEFAI